MTPPFALAATASHADWPVTSRTRRKGPQVALLLLALFIEASHSEIADRQAAEQDLGPLSPAALSKALGKLPKGPGWPQGRPPQSLGRQLGPLVRVPGKSDADERKQIVLPTNGDPSKLGPPEDFYRNSYVIEDKRYVEAYPSRCLSSTVFDEPGSVEPDFVLVRPAGEVRLRALASHEQLRQAGFEPELTTVMLIHGFTQSYPQTEWLRQVRALYEQNGRLLKENLIIMDWGKAANRSYSEAAALTSMMGSFAANLVAKLADLGAERRSIWLIGHSLGAHVAGFAGKRLRPRIGRITALDPAGPCFGKVYSNGPTDRLGPDDAIEVDVLHYDDEFLGSYGALGQFDVYVNGGKKQPGCMGNANSYLQAALTLIFNRNRVLSESHARSYQVATGQLAWSGCQEVAYECESFEKFNLGECGQCNEANERCFLMSLPWQYGPSETGAPAPHRQPLRTSFPGKQLYIQTADIEPYCLNHYQVLVRLEPDPEALKEAGGHPDISDLQLFTDERPVQVINISHIHNQWRPYVYSYLLLLDARPVKIRMGALSLKAPKVKSTGYVDYLSGPVDALRSAWDSAWGGFSLATRRKDAAKSTESRRLRVASVDIHFMSNADPNLRRGFSSRLCADSWRQDPNYSHKQRVHLSECAPVGLAPLPSPAQLELHPRPLARY